MFTHRHACTHTNTNICMNTYISTHVTHHTHNDKHTHAYTHTHTHIHTHTHTHTHTLTHTKKETHLHFPTHSQATGLISRIILLKCYASTNKGVKQTQQQRPESPLVTHTWHANKFKVHKLHQRYVLSTRVPGEIKRS